ncbi:MAG: TonB-dependent receptor [Tannerella sp.]|jgi:TonB-linked SusC/RagA family outer membrane protein|nr:TonB-dependent receptor [Tannerella sp.]
MKHLLFYVCLLASCCTLAVQGQQKVSGTVTTAEDGSPVDFVTVNVKGTTVTSVTGLDGTYVITLPAGNRHVLVFSFFGMKTKEVAVGEETIVNVTLENEVYALDDVIVVAYGTSRKGTFTGAASTVKQEAIKDVPAVSFQNALTGKVAGLDIASRSGQAGATPTLRIRGIGSMNASNEPLYVIDGVPVVSGSAGQLSSALSTDINNVMSTINPSDIESITVLKDAAASALYGSRAANGVVLIQTKRGQSGKARIDFKASYGFTPSFATKNWEAASTEQNVEMYYSMFWNAGIYDENKSPEEASTEALRQLNNRFNRHGYTFEAPDHTVNSLTIGGARAGSYFDWEDALLRTAGYQTYDLAVSGGSNTTNYYTSISYTKDQGRSVVNDYDRLSARLNLSQKIGNYLEFSSNMNLAKSNQKGFNDSRNTSTNPFMQLRNLLWGMYWPTNYVDDTPWTARYGSYAYNHIYHNNEWDNGAGTLRISAIETLTAHLLPFLDLKSALSYDNSQTLEFLYYSRNHYNGSGVGGSIDNYSTNVNKIVSSTTLNFNREIVKDHTLSLLAGFEAEKNLTDYQRSSGTDLPTTAVKTVATAGKLDASAYSWAHNMMSVFSRAEYNHANRYYLSGSYRRDGSSRLGMRTRWGDFWSVAGAWRIKEESFMQPVEWLSNLRLRASYGVNGTLPVNNYGHIALTSYADKYMMNPGGTLATVPNPDLSWETSYTYNVAVEFGLFDRINGSVEYFNRDSKNLLQDVPISLITGLGSTLSNVGEINNKGLEIELNADLIRTKDLTWNVGVTASTVQSKVTKLYGGQDIRWTVMDSRANYIYREGYSPLSFIGREWAGVDRETGKNIWFLNNDEASDLTIDGRGVTYDYRQADEVIYGKADPKLYGGLSSSLAWKGFTLDLGFIYKLGGKIYDGVSKDVADDGYYWERIRSQAEYDNRWTPENKNGSYPMMIAIDLEDVNQRSSRHLHSGSFARLKNTTLAYTLPKHIAAKCTASSIRVYFAGANLWTVSAYNVYDPEVGADGSKGWEMPLGKTYSFGLELSF